MLLEEISGPDDLRALGNADLDRLCTEIRELLVTAVARTGGHLGPNLGVVELTIALHRVFDSPRDRIVFDTGHQAYVHKMLTGRADRFDTLRQHGGMSGYPSRSESEHDIVENSHASTGLSYGLALATARELRGEGGKVICVIGDGALTGGMAYEALNNIGQRQPELIIILNDNGRSYAPTVGGIAENLGQLRLSPKYERAKGAAGQTLRQLPVFGESAYGAAKRMKDSLKQLVSPISIFETLGLKYGGPIDGHDIRALEKAMRDASAFKGPVVIHVVTDKGHGYAPAVGDEVDKFHGVSSFDPSSGAFSTKPAAWTDVFSEALLEAAEADDRIVAITAAMASSTGLLAFAERFPERFFDVGIAEQHAVTFAAGLAMQGLRPVVCIYSTFLQRAFDQVTCDVALHKLPVTFVLDRAGITGDDGASHHGMLDLAYLRLIPGMTVSAPSSPDELRRLFATAIAHDGPFAIRYPRGSAPSVGSAPLRPLPIGSMSVLREGADVALLAVGKMVGVAGEAADTLQGEGIHCTVVDGRFVKPLDACIPALAARHRAVLTIEDGTTIGGFGDAVLEALAEAGVTVPTRRLGLPDSFIEHGAQPLLLHKLGLDASGVAEAARELLRTHRPSVLAG
ncbi:MAG: 1-deoxy-D-xylulose-5-phosphate synthase [Candidatus Dormibacteraeota bacterium]|uniref:1-deoxy-D-xylulose-5-phosphate synthase n=2 Tax=Candidatus Aeolococcus gillhamiae TaxID=3127015 RepID=A0A934JY61_9BACT|nr:1-deoxy-D-xylulose-5-phosphate synthase [Candidatus Dormibacteraeota bacterium]